MNEVIVDASISEVREMRPTEQFKRRLTTNKPSADAPSRLRPSPKTEYYETNVRVENAYEKPEANNQKRGAVVEESSQPQSLLLYEQEQPSLISTIFSSDFYSDVWYRCFLKPMTRKHRPVPYRDSFQRRVLQQIGIPVAQLNCGLHGIFRRPEYPLIGMVFTYNNFIDNLYRYGEDEDAKEPAVQLIRMLFHALPGEDIQTTHLGGCAGAHLTPSIIGRVFEAWEAAKPDITYEYYKQQRLGSRLGRAVPTIDRGSS